jgi:hypothetical protein
VKFDIGDFDENRSKIPNLVNIRRRYRALDVKTYVLLLLAALNHHISAIFECNGIRLLGCPRRYKCHAKAPQCYFVPAYPVLLN